MKMSRLLRYLKQKYFGRELKKVREELEDTLKELSKKTDIYIILSNYYRTTPHSDPDKDRKSITQWFEKDTSDVWELHGKIQNLGIKETKLIGKLFSNAN